jgi:ferrous iron transport protein B
MKIALVGQPNSGKSTIFNSVAGYKTAVSNFPGSTIEFTRSSVHCGGDSFELYELPGIYSLSGSEEVEQRARHHLAGLGADAVINVIDASTLSRSLELTLELLELGVPLVVCLNMMDEAERKGVSIDIEHMQKDLGVPVIPAVAARGRGLTELFRAAVEAACSGRKGIIFHLSRDVEGAVEALASRIGEASASALGLPARFLALKLLEQDETTTLDVGRRLPQIMDDVEKLRNEIEQAHGRPSDMVISSERHALSMNLFEHVAAVRRRTKRDLRDRVDRYVMHPFWGYVILILVLFGFFYLVFGLGKLIEEPVLAFFESLAAALGGSLEEKSLVRTLLGGLIQGFSGGIGIVLPYLVPFLAGLAVLEDIGYIPRVAFLMDGLMHRIGLHGKAVIPFVLGYGCTVPAIMGTRIMENPRDRFVTALLVNFIPCAARTTIIFALVGFYLGAGYALGFYILNIVVIALAGRLLLRFRPEASPGLILEIPRYRLPSAPAVARKVWFRLREFIVLAWPILIAGSVVLSLLEHFRLEQPINGFFAPFTAGLLGLPVETSITLIFGVLRKELSIIMLVQALGTSDFASVMSTGQMVVFTAFSLFYVPCLATLAMLRSVIGWRGMLYALLLTTTAAVLVALVFRAAFFFAM